jgi:hypothetical protein
MKSFNRLIGITFLLTLTSGGLPRPSMLLLITIESSLLLSLKRQVLVRNSIKKTANVYRIRPRLNVSGTNA